ncbi:uncharacterized protein LOC112904275 [Agrilus planipennis]|uniref:Uncharacterized protein LOC108732348 n=1 Tax=Agrilus planipennis TaxID=224129 RepID=A0A1W4W377_AGRPL|nr:uncharacterized protein LOC108732348 [Agrilus planipennis]XP_025829703.1 uncharacterized protein LOC112904275 [Agrilus planipennis]
MAFEEKNSRFKFHQNVCIMKKGNSSPRKCRKKLQDRFNDSESSSNKNNRSVLSVLSLNNSRKMLRTGTEKFHKGLNNFRTTLTSLSQRFRGTRRRHILEETNFTPNAPNGAPATPLTFSKTVLGRTPTKLYSPFGIETPTLAQPSTSLNDSNASEHITVMKEKRSKSDKLKRLIMMR